MSKTHDLPHVFPTVVHMLADAAARAPESIALVCGERRLSYAQYLRCVAGFAREMIAHGARGSRVALVCGNSLDMPIATFASHAAGAQATPINPAYTTRELTHIFTDAAPAAIVYDAEAAAAVEPLIASLGIPYSVRLSATDRTLDRWKDDAAQSLPELPQPDSLATLQYTGGTTGLPKGVNLTHRQTALNISQREAAPPTCADDECVLCMMPLFHVFAVAMCLHLSVYCRGRLVIMPRYSSQGVLDLFAKERITRLPAGPTETAEALRDGWLYTGDIGELDADGYLYIRDRKKDMVIVGGYNVYPREVEEVLFAHADVKEAACAGVPDSYYGETARAFVVLKPNAQCSEADLIAYCKNNLVHYKTPSRIFIVEALPRTSVGKIDRIQLRNELTRRAAE